MKKALVIGSSFLLPFIAGAQLTDIEQNIVTPIGKIINLLIPIVFALALLYFFWGLAKYILSSGDQAARDDGKHMMIWGIVALFVMASVWGLVKFLGDSIGISQNAGPSVGNILPKP